ALANADFFNNQLMRQIEQSQPPTKETTSSSTRQTVWSFWTLPRMAWTGGFCLLLAGALYFASVPQSAKHAEEGQKYATEILSASSDDPNITVSIHPSKDSN